ncbi:MAG: hypothetical protein JO088_00945 [Acidobacteria bacterium]|nr:hypothetical protein [Acidobacteriota bacterium]
MKPLLATIAITLVAPALFATANLRIASLPSQDPVRGGLRFALEFLVQNLGPDIAKKRSADHGREHEADFAR